MHLPSFLWRFTCRRQTGGHRSRTKMEVSLTWTSPSIEYSGKGNESSSDRSPHSCSDNSSTYLCSNDSAARRVNVGSGCAPQDRRSYLSWSTVLLFSSLHSMEYSQRNKSSPSELQTTSTSSRWPFCSHHSFTSATTSSTTISGKKTQSESRKKLRRRVRDSYKNGKRQNTVLNA